MKKSVVSFLFIALGLSCGFAKTWTNNIGVGVSVPFSKIEFEEKDNIKPDDISQMGFAIESTYLGYHENGFTAKADYAFGVFTTDDVNIQGDTKNVGIGGNVDIGAGYSFIRNEKFTLATTLMFGLSLYSYFDHGTSDKDTVDEKEYDTVMALCTLDLGADIFASYRLSEHFGLFANLGIRYYPVGVSGSQTDYEWKEGSTKYTKSDESDNYTLSGKYKIAPTLGVVWNF